MQRANTYARLIIALLAALLLAYPIAALAQPVTVRDGDVRRPTPRLHFGGGIQVMQGVGAFADSVDVGIGAGINARYNIDRRGIFSLRGDFGFQIYGNEQKRIAFPTAPRVTLEQNTNNQIYAYSIGPQLMWPTGRVRPYANGFIGGAYYTTTTSLKGSGSGESFASSENFGDNNLSYGGGAGVLIPFRTNRTPVALDLGARYLHNGTARYLKPGSIQDDGDTYSVRYIEGPANFVVYTIGLSIGSVRRDGRDGRERGDRR
jgi:opacity protein-like surface antigen